MVLSAILHASPASERSILLLNLGGRPWLAQDPSAGISLGSAWCHWRDVLMNLPAFSRSGLLLGAGSAGFSIQLPVQQLLQCPLGGMEQ